MNVVVRLESYEGGTSEELQVTNHWHGGKFVVLKVGQASVVVYGPDLKRAVDSCMDLYPEDPHISPARRYKKRVRSLEGRADCDGDEDEEENMDF